MPKKASIDRNLVRINITEKAHKILLSKKIHGEPIYRVFDRILSSYIDNDASDWQDLYYQQVEATKTWQTRALEAEKKLGTVQRTLI